MPKTHKVMDIIFHGTNYICIYFENRTNPYVLYKKWYDKGWHKKKLTEFCTMDDVLFLLLQSYHKAVVWDVSNCGDLLA